MALFKKDTEGHYWRLHTDKSNGEHSWMNRFGASHPFRDGDLREFSIYEACGWKDLNWQQAYLRYTLDRGWIDREGHFYGCDDEDHDNLCEYVLGHTREEVERLGWVKVNPMSWQCFDSNMSGRRLGVAWQQLHWSTDTSVEKPKLSERQRVTLAQIGRDPDSYRYRDTTVEFKDVFPNGYRGRTPPIGTAKRISPVTNLRASGSVPQEP